MFLTRLGFGSKIVVTGDVTQIDLPGGTRSGLNVVRDILLDVDDVHFAQLSSSDVVRHRLVADIVDAYARWDTRQRAPEPAGRRPAQRPAAGPPLAPPLTRLPRPVENLVSTVSRAGSGRSWRCGTCRWGRCGGTAAPRRAAGEAARAPPPAWW